MRHSRSVHCAEVAGRGGEEALGVAAPLARQRRLAEDLDVLAGHHAQAAAAEDAVDVGGRHRSLLSLSSATAGAAAPARLRGVGIGALQQQHGRVVDAAALRAPARPAPGSAARASTGRGEHAAPVGAVEVLVDAVAAEHEQLAAAERVHARRWRRRSRRCRPCAPGRRGEPPGGGASPRWPKVSSRVSSSSCAGAARRPAIDAAVADPGDEPARRRARRAARTAPPSPRPAAR